MTWQYSFRFLTSLKIWKIGSWLLMHYHFKDYWCSITISGLLVWCYYFRVTGVVILLQIKESLLSPSLKIAANTEIFTEAGNASFITSLSIKYKSRDLLFAQVTFIQPLSSCFHWLCELLFNLYCPESWYDQHWLTTSLTIHLCLVSLQV